MIVRLAAHDIFVGRIAITNPVAAAYLRRVAHTRQRTVAIRITLVVARSRSS